MSKYISCPRCGHVIGTYNEDLEAQRKVECFKSYCTNCSCVSIPLILDGGDDETY